MSYFYSEANELSKDGAKQWALLWQATTSRPTVITIENFISHAKKVTRRCPKFSKYQNLVDS